MQDYLSLRKPIYIGTWFDSACIIQGLSRFSSRKFIGNHVLLRFCLRHLARSICISTNLLHALKHFKFIFRI